MSQVYSTEPQTTGRVILETTAGVIDIQLWCKECPTTTRAFLQLCLDGYYDGMIFHRIINEFLIQTGVKRRSESAVNETQLTNYMNAYVSKDATDIQRKRLEVVPRIKFNHRGLVALALPLDQDTVDDNEASSLVRQFFITMDEAPFLDKKYVIFGTVRGDTIFNALRIGKTETMDDNSGELVDLQNAPTIRSIRIDHHTFDDLTATPDLQVPWKKTNENDNIDKQIKKKKRKGKKDINVLSFGGELEEVDDGLAVSSRMKSSHDEIKSHTDDKLKNNKKRRDNDSELPLHNTNSSNQSPALNLFETETKMVYQKSNLQAETNPSFISFSTAGGSESTSIKPQDEVQSWKIDVAQQSQSSKVSAVELRRMKYMNSNGTRATKKGSKARDDETMAKLLSFKTKMFQVKGMKDHGNLAEDDEKTSKKGLSDNSLASRLAKKLENKHDRTTSVTKQVPVYSGQILEDDYEANDSTWLKSTFKCKRHMDHDSKANAMVDGDDFTDRIVINTSRAK